MPELPEVETMCRGILPIVGSRIVDIRRAKCQLRPIKITPEIDLIEGQVAGCFVTDIQRLGKRVVLMLDDFWSLVFQPKMTGLVLVGQPPNQEHLRVKISLEGGPVRELLYWDRRGLGTVSLFSASEFAAEFANGRLGEDALSISFANFHAAFRDSARPVKVALLDQSKVAGIGNLYASEILHASKVSPAKPCNKLSKPRWLRIYQNSLAILQEAILHEGSTLSDGTYRNALNDPGGYQNQHRVYDRADLPCPTCQQSAIRRIVQAQRATFYCPKCQKN